MQKNEWIDKVIAVELPRWDDLPELSLYLDQVLEYVNAKMSLIFRVDNHFVTASMINNYVKHKLMPAPIKKRYTKQHLAYIIAISFIKQVVTIQQISEAIQIHTQHYGKKMAYNNFINSLESAIRISFAQLKDPTKIIEIRPFEDKNIGMLYFVTISFASKLITEYLLEEAVKEKGGSLNEK